jgi:hypothetical protein
MKPRTQPIKIVKARREHLPRVIDLMRELAEFENLLGECVVTEELLAEHLFTAHPLAELLVGYVGDAVCGYAFFFHNF